MGHRVPGLPPDCVEVRSAAGDWIARRACAAAIARGEADFILSGAGARQTAAGSGRGPLARLTLAGIPAVGKRALHGGLLGPLFGGLYLGRRRAIDQLRASVRLAQAGVPTPEILAVGTRRVAGILHAQAIVAREIPDARNLHGLAGEPLSGARRREILDRTAGVLRDMHDAGFEHADLNLANLVWGRGPAGETLFVVDLERGRFADPIRAGGRIQALARLVRSCEKWVAGPHRLTPREEVRFLLGYARGDRALVLLLATRLGRYRRRLGARRLAWRLRELLRSEDRLARPLE
ncbi:MAG TPA: lipopolysaccharide kinase InaA family protein [Candidatus Polarisedimenticolia bacterium]|nr:lipopolysaccharide kinase InaA family protein [Candidatus Polarisedimenticolia bacterium]